MAATIKDIAQQTGLGLATISKYINGGNVREENKELIDKAIKDLNYTVNEFARGLKSNKSKLIGVVIPELPEIFPAQIISEFEAILRKNNYSVIVCDCHSDKKLECNLVKFLLNKRVDGIINMPVNSDGKHLLPAIENGVPVVIFDRFIKDMKGKADFVLADNLLASKNAVELLSSNGHKEIGIIAGPADNFTAVARLEGFQKTAKERSINPSLVFNGDYTIQGGFECMMDIMENHKHITAVYATNYFMTLGAIMAMNENKTQEEKNISFIGFDNIELTRILKPSPCMICQPMADIGKSIARIMLSRLTGEPLDPASSVITLPTTIEIGQSVHNVL